MNCKLVILVRNKLLWERMIFIKSVFLFYWGLKAMQKYPVYTIFMFTNVTYVVLSRT